MTSRELELIRAEWVLEGAESDLGLWWLANDLREVLGQEASEATVIRATLAAVEPLLLSGQLRVVDLHEGGRFEVWMGEVGDILRRIQAEWEALGRRPTIGDVAWFIGPRAGR